MNTPGSGLQDTMVVDGGDMTAEEARLSQLGTPDIGDAADYEDDDANKGADDEAARLQAAQDAEAQRIANEAAQRQQAPAEVVQLEEPKKPETRDFEAERAALRAKYDDGTLTAIELADEREKLLRAEFEQRELVRDYERDLAAYTKAKEGLQQKAELDWNTAAVAWEAEHQDFLSNPLRHADMQRAIGAISAMAREKGEVLTPTQLLDKAYTVAAGYSNYQAPEGHPKPGDVRAALEKRKGGEVQRTLGDVPNAGNEAITSTTPFAQLDGLNILDLEAAVANMTPEQQERYLRDSPGSNTRGRAADTED